jgi:pre-mRNA-splicing factor ATP-dependent RNA helicase DHX16
MSAPDSIIPETYAFVEEPSPKKPVKNISDTNSMSEIKKRSRQEYLKKREEQKLMSLKMNIYQEEEAFHDISLSEAEKTRLIYNKQILRIAEERKKLDQPLDRYALPDTYEVEKDKEKRRVQEDSLYKRYSGKSDYKDSGAEWQESQISKAGKISIGTQDSKYELLLDDEVEFESFSDNDEEEIDLEEVGDKRQEKIETILETRCSLPVFAYREELLQAILDYQTIIVVGETGSGKTTQIPQYLVEAGYATSGKKIGCTQPRRVAAMSVAARVSEEMNTKIGHEVGYSIRFEDCTSEKTIIKYMTDGMLLREFLNEPDLSSYKVLIIDEAHERTLHTDILFGLVKDIAKYRSDLKILISSATLDAEKFSCYFDNAPIFRIPGRRYPVTTYYTKAPEADYLAAAVTTTMQIHLTQADGDILVFLTGQEEIESMQERLNFISKKLKGKMKEMIVVPIYASLPPELQAEIFKPTPIGARKVVLATNIAETSITIDGISYVIDPGFCKMNTYNPRNGLESLSITPCSRASANQRSGRAGRVGPGKCFRLYTSWAFKNEMDENTIPEIQRTNLGNVVLLLKSLGIDDLLNFDFLDPPPAETLLKALESLYALGALNDNGELTKLGRKMAEFPLDPMLSKTVISSDALGCTREVVTIVSMLSLQNSVFFRPKDRKEAADSARKAFEDSLGDHLSLLNIWRQYEESNYSNQWCLEHFIQIKSMKKARDVRDQLLNLLERVEIDLKSSSDHDSIRKAFTMGFFSNSAQIQKSGECFRSIKHNQSIYIHPSSVLFGHQPKFVIYFELMFTTKEYMRQILEISPEWLLDAAPHYFKSEDIECDFKPKSQFFIE